MNLTDIMNAASVADTSAECTNCRRDSSMSAFPAETPIGMAYVPYQKWKNVYEANVALERGTIFEDLDKPFLGERAV